MLIVFSKLVNCVLEPKLIRNLLHFGCINAAKVNLLDEEAVITLPSAASSLAYFKSPLKTGVN